MDTVVFRPEVARWWLALEALPERLGRVHRLVADEYPPDAQGPHAHQHHTATLVVCLAGVVRLIAGRQRFDLGATDAAVIEAGAWHSHAPLRPGVVCFGQGFMGGRSDWLLASPNLNMVSSVPTQPSLRAVEEIAAAHDEAARRRLLAEHLRTFVTETSEPISDGNAVYPAMELALWDNLHRSGAVAAMVQASGLSRAQAYRVFTAYAGVAPAAALRRERIALARRLLAEGVSSHAVAERCGLGDARALRRLLARDQRAMKPAPPSSRPPAA